MSMAFWQRLAISALFGFSAGSLSSAVQAAQFDQQEIDQTRFIVLAAPGGEIGYKLLILEQLNDKRPCWSETGTNPSDVEPLLLNFDFTGICNRIVDSNGFSVRTAGEDQGLQYSLRVLQQDGDLVLVAASNSQRNTYVEIGRTNGLPTGFSRIVLNPGWRLTRRAFNGRPVGHIYLTSDQPIATLLATNQNGSTVRPSTTILQPPSSTPAQTPGLPEVIPVPSLPPTPSNIEVPPRPNPQPALPRPQASNSGGPSIILPPPPPENADIATAPVPPVPPISGSSAPATGTATPVTETTANSSNARLLPPSLRRTPAGTSSNPTSNPTSSNPTSNPTTASTSNANQRQAAAAPTTSSTSRSSDRPTAPSATASSTTVAQAETYQVVVVADSAETQDKVRSVAPNAFLTTINGQVVMQVGIFRDRQEADQLQQRLSLEGLPTAVIPVR